MTALDAPLLGLSQRLPPSNLAAEQALLGALLANNKAYERVSDYLAPDHFADPLHGRIFAAIGRRIEAGQLADAVMLKAEFEHSGVLEEVGGTAYLAQLLTAMVGIINAGEYGRAIHDAWLRRQLVEIGEVVVNRAFGAEPELDGRQQIEAAESRAVPPRDRWRRRGRVHDLRPRARAGDRGGGARIPPLGPRLRPLDRVPRPRRQDGGDARVRPADPGRAAGHGQDGTRDQDRFWRGTGAGGRSAGEGPGRGAARGGCDLLARDECRAVGDATARRAGAHLRRPHPPRRDRAEGVRPLRAGDARDREPADPHRRHAGDHALRAAHPLPPARAHAGTEPRHHRLPATDAPGGRHQA